MIPLYWLDTSQGPGINEQVESNDIIPQTIKERETPVKDQKLANVVAFISNAIEKSFGNSLWSVYTALTFFDQKVKLFGAFSSVVLMLSLIITYAIGKFVDTVRYYKNFLIALLNCELIANIIGALKVSVDRHGC